MNITWNKTKKFLFDKTTSFEMFFWGYFVGQIFMAGAMILAYTLTHSDIIVYLIPSFVLGYYMRKWRERKKHE